MIKLIARYLSLIFNPFLVLVFLPFVLVYKTTSSLETSIIWTLYTFIFFLVIAIYVLLNVRNGVFTDMDVSKREQRPVLFEFFLILSGVYLLGITIFNGPAILLYLVISVILSIFVVSLLNRRIKLSLHVATLSALLSAVTVYYQGYSFFLLLLIPLIAWSRVKVKRHTVEETVVGAIVGSALSLAAYTVLRLAVYNT